ncbi:hypothetical protein G6514_005016 [Epicoccum nigrum]|nr:hypothetical protein G6514_005016 [Epicoccum nigrum]
MASDRTPVLASKAPAPPPFLSQAIRDGNLLFCSGQIGTDPSTSSLVEGTVQDRTRQILRNLSAVLEAGGSSLALVNKVNIFLVEPTDFAPMNEVYNTFFEGVKPVRVYPQELLVSLPTMVPRMKQRDYDYAADGTNMHQARTCVFVKALPLGTDVEIECVARVSETAKL